MTKDVPSSAQIELAKAIAYQTGKRLPRGYTVRLGTCAEFIEENKAYIRPTESQVSFALGLARIYQLKMQLNDFLSYEFCKKFLNLFAGTKGDFFQGYRRMKIIESYLQEDKEFEHLQFKLDLSAKDVAFMKQIIVTFRHDKNLIRWDDKSSKETAFLEFEDNLPSDYSTEPSRSEELSDNIELLHSLTEEEIKAILVPSDT